MLEALESIDSILSTISTQLDNILNAIPLIDVDLLNASLVALVGFAMLQYLSKKRYFA